MRITIDEDDLNYIINNIEDINIIEKLTIEKEKWKNNIKSSKRTLAAEKATKFRENLVKDRLRITFQWFDRFGYTKTGKSKRITKTLISKNSDVSYNTTKKYFAEIEEELFKYQENIYTNKVNYCELNHKVFYQNSYLYNFPLNLLAKLQGNDSYSSKYKRSPEYKEKCKKWVKDYKNFYIDLGFKFKYTKSQDKFIFNGYQGFSIPGLEDLFKS